MIKSKFDYRKIGNGKTTIVIETGIGNSYFDWLPIADKLSDNHTIILYHRLGYGKSIEPSKKRTTYNIATELLELVNELHIDKFILLAHSFGGLCAQHFAILHPERLIGLILLDSTSPRLVELEELDTPFFNEHCSIEAMIKMSMEFSRNSKEELKIRQGDTIKENQERLDGDDFEEYKSFVTSTVLYRTVANEFSEWLNDGAEIQNTKDQHNIPTKIICRDNQVSVENWIMNGVPKSEAVIHENHWRKLQEDLKKISIESELIIATGCDHMIHTENQMIIYDAINSIELH